MAQKFCWRPSRLYKGITLPYVGGGANLEEARRPVILSKKIPK